MKYKIAEYKMIVNEHIIDSVGEWEDYMEDHQDYIRTSEVVEVELEKLPYGEAEKHEIDSIDKQIQKVRAETEVKIGRLETRRQELLAIGSDQVA